MRHSFYIIFISLSFACNSDELNPDLNTSDQPNILLLIADDMGKDATAGYSEGSIKPNTPNINSIRDEGLQFNNFWAYPTCTPTRSSIITGKYGYNTEVKNVNDVLDNSETILQKFISEEQNNLYANALIGKWHLSGSNQNSNPEDYGIDYYIGLLRGGLEDYYSWNLFENGSFTNQEEYATKVFTDLSIDWINNQDKPWFLWLAYNAAHTPFHIPPAEMHSQGNLAPYEEGSDATPYYLAAIEAMDFQIGRLLDAIPLEELENTVIIFIGDNGTPNQVAQFPYSNRTAKGTLYQGGINVPMFISGAGVNRTGEIDNLVCSTDLFMTIANIAGINGSEMHDSRSFNSLFKEDSTIRSFQYSEIEDDTKDLWTISDGNYKLLVNANGEDEMYNLNEDPYENENILEGTLSNEESTAKAKLETELLSIRN